MTFVPVVRSRNTEAFEFAAIATFLRSHVPVRDGVVGEGSDGLVDETPHILGCDR
jgi:hypothetical protein